ncbi:MAG: ABC transporter permease [Eubacteriales bacterium]|nr:ABC transporter permease [Eubacteriales bacterium]
MKTMVIAGRVIRQITGDKRTLAVMLIAPVIILSLLYCLLAFNVTKANIDLVGGNRAAADTIADVANVTAVGNAEEAESRLKAGESDGYIDGDRFVAEGTDPAITALAKRAFSQYAMKQRLSGLPQQFAAQAGNIVEQPQAVLLYGGENYGQFDFLAPSMMGFIIFFLVFLLAGIAFLRERISGTMDRILVSSLRRSQLVAGYFLGFGLFAALQTIVIQIFLVYVLKIQAYENFALILVVNLFVAGTSLAMGTLFSAFARNEFQLFQFIPIVIIPQVMFCGLFNLRDTPLALQYLARIFPLTYGADALRSVMLRGAGLADVWQDLAAMFGFTLLFLTLNIRVLRKYRAI